MESESPAVKALENITEQFQAIKALENTTEDLEFACDNCIYIIERFQTLKALGNLIEDLELTCDDCINIMRQFEEFITKEKEAITFASESVKEITLAFAESYGLTLGEDTKKLTFVIMLITLIIASMGEDPEKALADVKDALRS